ncbi:uncharacterized protein LOC116350306 [Contarinia nasturtii]|uniref:uncharacterized protein LOC116350306 n=1 Tax=Contarinia nasturtii TaxID=265458 RepID=UPI0012D4C31D|nr:uncharacterized protein LOC116350306 [Contarinia nasturtii]
MSNQSMDNLVMFSDYNVFFNETLHGHHKNESINDDVKIQCKSPAAIEQSQNPIDGSLMASSQPVLASDSYWSGLESAFYHPSEWAQLLQKQLNESVALVKSIQNNVTNIDSTNQLNIETLQMELKMAQKAIADHQFKNNALLTELRNIASERDLEKMEAQKELINAKEFHGQEIAMINQIHEFIYKEAIIVQNQDKEDLRVKHQETIKKLEKNHRRECDEIRRKYKKITVSEKERTRSDTNHLEQRKKIRQMEEKVKAITKEKNDIESQMENNMETKDIGKTVITSKSDHDKYCWYCHGLNRTFNCSTCFRSYHPWCININLDNIGVKNSESCSACIFPKRSKDPCTEESLVQLKMLNYIMTDVERNSDFKMLKNLQEFINDPKIFKSIDLNTMKKNFVSQKYATLYSFLVDIEGIYHNCFIMERNSTLSRTAKKLLLFCEDEVEAISSCTYCYENKHLRPHEWRTMACNRPHLILRVKLPSRATPSLKFWSIENGFKYWPAKFISGTTNQSNIKVIFFDDNKLVNISQENCQLYTTEMSMNEEHNQKDDINPALEELKQYATNVERKFNCRFVDTLSCTAFDLDRIDDHMNAMFSGYNDSLPTQKDPASTEEIPLKKRRIDNEASSEVDCFQQIINMSTELKSKFEVQKNELAAVTSERDRLKSELCELKDGHAKEMAELAKTVLAVNQIKITSLLTQIQVLTSENAVAKSALEKASDEMTTMKKKHNTCVEDQRKILQIDHQNTLKEFQIKLQNENDRNLGEIREQHKKELENEKERIIADFKNKVQNLF